MVEPGSFGMPDTLYAAALLGSFAAAGGARDTTGTRPGPLGIAAQLLRYPGALVAALLVTLGGHRRAAARMLAQVLLLAALFGAYGLATGELEGWLATLAWETGPEHWHGDTSAASLVPRVPAFAAQLLAYAGGTPVLAAVVLLLAGVRPAAPAQGASARGAWALIGATLAQTLLLGTIDHHPSHYFLPLVAMSATALALASERRHGALWSLAGAAGLVWSWARVAVVG